jgi:hypothetical protein
MITLYLITPRSVLRFTFGDIIVYTIIAFICMEICTLIESARVHNDIISSLFKTTRELDEAAEGPAISDEKYVEATKVFLPLENKSLVWLSVEEWVSKFRCVRLTLSIPYIVSDADLIRNYRNWRGHKKGFYG